MPKIEECGDGWYIAGHREGVVEVLEAALPSGARMRLEHIEGSEEIWLEPCNVALKVQSWDERKGEYKTARWEKLDDLRSTDLVGIAALLLVADDHLNVVEKLPRWWEFWKRRRRDDGRTSGEAADSKKRWDRPRATHADEGGAREPDGPGGGVEDDRDLSADGGGGG
ncbi:MAG: hypothetical protein GY769_07865 [bacterium]|nr:hypothetical protein [bacterium]